MLAPTSPSKALSKMLENSYHRQARVEEWKGRSVWGKGMEGKVLGEGEGRFDLPKAGRDAARFCSVNLFVRIVIGYDFFP